MDNISHFKALFDYLEKLNPSYDLGNEIITISSGEVEVLRNLNINYTTLPTSIEFNINQFDYLLFFDDNEFRIKWKSFVISGKDAAILNIKTKPIFFSKLNKQTLENFVLSSNTLFTNAIIYDEFIRFFSDKSKDENNKFQFVDSFDTNTRKLFFTSSKEPGKLVIGYPLELSEFDNQTDYSINFNRLKDAFGPSNKNLPIFIKNEIFRYFEDKYDNQGFVTLFKDLNKVLNIAEKNYQIYLHDLSLDKIKSDYKEYKQKYFSSQNDILNKITTQVIALPISIAASAFSLYNLKGELFPTLIVCFGLVSYIVYVTFIVRIYFDDITSLNNIAQKDYKTLKDNSFFINNKEDLGYFEEIKNGLFKRLNLLKKGLNIFIFIMWISSLCLVFYSFKMLSIKIGVLILPFIAVTFTCAYVYQTYLNKEELKNE
ncbi:hypothetical protein EZL74_07035 [Flavobacterium silvisoli]|uniref:Uncharacterized protein n=1 Tax=Flavobacterium silvisoli TaxID=2529433 RepID=A0A4Q9Z098_9FLAO|nr:hypothetical protein [Flavobacterium silvisoli]TBX69625.1 hypothetical protein EZL74_07035 [Flavobacterium silvisoli]